MKRRDILGALAAAAVLPTARARTGMPSVQVFKDPGCGCCGAWVQHLEKAGFVVKVTEVTDTAAARSKLGMPAQYGGCHTATVEGYVIEGHVPAAEIRQLLLKRPAALGLAVPGMPVGSPGMEMGPRVDPYEVLLVDHQGRATVFARYPKKARRPPSAWLSWSPTTDPGWRLWCPPTSLRDMSGPRTRPAPSGLGAARRLAQLVSDN